MFKEAIPFTYIAEISYESEYSDRKSGISFSVVKTISNVEKRIQIP